MLVDIRNQEGNFKPKKLHFSPDKPFPENKILEENDLEEDENVQFAAIVEIEHDHVPTSSTSSQTLNFEGKIIDEVSEDSILMSDQRINEIVDNVDFHNATPIGLKNIYYNDGSHDVCFFNDLIQTLGTGHFMAKNENIKFFLKFPQMVQFAKLTG